MASITLSFKFANFDNTTSPLNIPFPDSTQILTVKQQVFEKWPTGCPKPDSVKGFVLIAMGRQLEDSSTLKSSGVPKYDWPTPVHVAVKTAAKPKVASESVGNPHYQHHSEGGSSCCVIM